MLAQRSTRIEKNKIWRKPSLLIVLSGLYHRLCSSRIETDSAVDSCELLDSRTFPLQPYLSHICRVSTWVSSPQNQRSPVVHGPNALLSGIQIKYSLQSRQKFIYSENITRHCVEIAQIQTLCEDTISDRHKSGLSKMAANCIHSVLDCYYWSDSCWNSFISLFTGTQSQCMWMMGQQWIWNPFFLAKIQKLYSFGGKWYQQLINGDEIMHKWSSLEKIETLFFVFLYFKAFSHIQNSLVPLQLTSFRVFQGCCSL